MTLVAFSSGDPIVDRRADFARGFADAGDTINLMVDESGTWAFDLSSYAGCDRPVFGRLSLSD